jgi:hypothetical protein
MFCIALARYQGGRPCAAVLGRCRRCHKNQHHTDARFLSHAVTSDTSVNWKGIDCVVMPAVTTHPRRVGTGTMQCQRMVHGHLPSGQVHWLTASIVNIVNLQNKAAEKHKSFLNCLLQVQ